MLLAILVLGLAGTGTELVLLQHYGDGWQLVPLVLIAAALAAVVWHVLTRGPASVLVLRALMSVFLASGFVGLGFHWQANAEFEREADPSLGGVRLLMEAFSGATPALAPGTMIQLGLIGLLYGYKHPRLGAESAQIDHSRREQWDD